MSRTFATATTDRVNCGSAAALDALQQVTTLSWIYPTSFVAGAFVAGKRTSGNAGWGCRMDDTLGNLYMNKPTSAGVTAVTNDAPLRVNASNFVATSGSNAISTNNCRIYTGNLSTLAVERSYGTQGSLAAGTAFNDAAEAYIIGNRHPAATTSFPGAIGIHALFNRVLTLGEIQSWQFDPRIMVGCVGLWLMDESGTITDYSGNGNTGTVTGATQSDSPPLRRSRRAAPHVAPVFAATPLPKPRRHQQAVHRASTY